MQEESPAPGWTTWHDGAGGTLVLTFRPDIFDGQRLPPACLPTITVKRERHRGPRGRPAGKNEHRAWTVELRLEPAVLLEQDRFNEREGAVDWAQELATAFANDELPYRGAYQRPRDDYLAILDDLLPADASETSDFSARRGNED